MKFSLNTTVIEPHSGQKPKNALILIHGYGGDGKDISLLSLNWKRFLPDTVFLCPDGPELCAVNPVGYQWFDLSNSDEKFILEKSLIAEKKLFQFINEVKIKYQINSKNICLSGFSQGCMMVLNNGLTSEQEFNCIVGFSGKIINPNNLIGRIKSRPKIFLLHGDKDSIVPPIHLLESKDFFRKLNYKIKTELIKNCEHNIPIEASSLALEFIKRNIK